MIKVYTSNRHYDRLFVIWDGYKYVCVDLEMPTLEVYDTDSVTHLKVANGNYPEIKPSDDRYPLIIDKYQTLQRGMVIDELLGGHSFE